MSCNTCGKSFSLLRKERGCPGCGFSYCSGCLKHKSFLPKLNTESKVCVKCSITNCERPPTREPPDAFLRRLESLENPPRPPITVYEQDKYQKLKRGLSAEDQQLVDRLQQLKQKSVAPSGQLVEQQIADRLNKLRSIDETPQSTTEQVQDRLSKLKGETSRPIPVVLPPLDVRTDEEKSDDIIRQYLEEVNIEERHKRSLDGRIDEIESRLQSLTGIKPPTVNQIVDSDSDNDEEIVRRVIEKAKAESLLDGVTSEKELTPASVASADTELPWCEICNEDATLRCFGCHYLFCKMCFTEHHDGDAECNKFEPYTKPKNAPIV